jgi:signal peptidase I
MSFDPLHRGATPLLRCFRKRTHVHFGLRVPLWRGERHRGRWPVVAVGLLACGVVKSGLRPGVVVGDSMAPTLRAGQWFVLDLRAYQVAPPQRGDIVVFRHREVTYIKRVLGAGGDTVRMLEVWDADGVWRSPVEPGFLERTRRLCRRDRRWRLVEQRVPAGHLYMLGDMVTRSMDSRHLGPIPVHEVRGQVRLLGVVRDLAGPAPPRIAPHSHGRPSSKGAEQKCGGVRPPPADDNSGLRRSPETSRKA